METMYISTNTSPLFVHESENEFEFKLIRGDEVQTTGFDPDQARTEVSWRGRTGWITSESLTTEAMLEVYFLDPCTRG